MKNSLQSALNFIKPGTTPFGVICLGLELADSYSHDLLAGFDNGSSDESLAKHELMPAYCRRC